jgi:hypothetical protein
MFKSGKLRTSVAESLLIVVSVLVALGAENWRESLNERALETEYLSSMAEGLRRDTAEFSRTIAVVNRRHEFTQVVLEGILSDGPPEDPEQFLLGVEASARYPVPTISDEAYQDLQASGQLGILQDTQIRRQAREYYEIFEDEAHELWRNRIWYQYGPVAIDVMPFEVQEWAASVVGVAIDAPTEPLPPPPDIDGVATMVADRFRATPRVEGLVKAVLRSNTNQLRTLESQRELADSLLGLVEATLEGR